MKTSLILLALALMLTGCSGLDQPLAPGPDSGTAMDKAAAPNILQTVLPPDAKPLGLTYAEWSAKWWQWLWSAPVDQNPGLDETGAFVDWGQEGHVWFLAPAYFGTYDRTADIPTGHMLCIDLAATFTAITTGDGANEQELRDAAAWVTNNVSNIIFEIDGQRLENVGDYRFTSPAGYFSYTLPENNMFQFFGLPVSAGTYDDAVSDGYFVMVNPLSAGEHTIFMSADFGEPYNDTIQVTYHLHVVGGHGHGHQQDKPGHGHP